MVRRIFITGTDTGAGKTYVTASLLRTLKESGRDVIGLKPVASGNEEAKINADVATLLKGQGLPDSEAPNINLYSFDAALAPSQAAAKEGRTIDPKALVDWCREMSSNHEISLIEGVGGLMVPLAGNYLVSDWLGDMPDCEVMLVVRARLGGINHALLTLDKLKHMGRPPKWIIINDIDEVGQVMLEQHQAALAAGGAETADQVCMPYVEERQGSPPALQQVISALL